MQVNLLGNIMPMMILFARQAPQQVSHLAECSMMASPPIQSCPTVTCTDCEKVKQAYEVGIFVKLCKGRHMRPV